jgi:hypothetical protein
LWRNWEESSSGEAGNWAGRTRGEPKVASAGERLERSCGVDRKERRIQGRWETQSGEEQRARRESLRRRWYRSIIPLDCGWKEVVVRWEICRREESWLQREEVNWEPRSEVRVWGIPKRAIQEEHRASAQAAGDKEERGTASSHLVVLSTIVKMYVFPWEGGRGPTRSMWMWEKRRCGMGMG